MLQDGGVFPQWNRQLLEDTTLLQMTLISLWVLNPRNYSLELVFLCRKSTLINPAISSTALTLRKWHISRGSEECLASIMCAWEYALTHFFNSIDIKNSRSNRLSLLFGHYSRLYIITMVTVSGNWLMETKRLAQTSICPGPAVFT